MSPANLIDLLQGPGKEFLEREVLPAYLPRCRWFGGKSRSIMGIAIQDRIQPPEGGEWALVILHVAYVDGSPENYLLPIALAEGEAAAALRLQDPQAIVTELADIPGRPTTVQTLLYEAVYHPRFRTRMLGLIATGSAWPGLTGSLRGHPRPDAFKDRMPDPSDESKVLKAEQSNTSIIFPGRYFVKFLRRLEEGENPELEILRYFAESTSFRSVPPFIGSLEYTSAAATASAPAITYSLAIAEGLIAHQQDAWTFALGLAGEYMTRLLESREGPGPLPPMSGGFRTKPLHVLHPIPESMAPGLSKSAPMDGLMVHLEEGPSLGFARLLGKRTAEMHLALAAHPDQPAFAPEPFTLPYQTSLHQGMRDQIDGIYGLLAKSLPRLPESTALLARRILDNRAKVMDAFEGLLRHPISTVKTRVHGDYHLGQVLYTGTDVVILDFEGEPARPLGERKLKRSPWKDVAGMLRSFHYAAHSAWPRDLGLRDEERKALDPWIELWPERMAAAFLEAYLEAAGNAAFVPAEKDWATLLRAHLMEKAVYELGYELNNRPDWAHIPMTGILKLI